MQEEKNMEIILTKHKFQDVTCKLGNMRAAQTFTLYPRASASDQLTIQSEKRIASVNLRTGCGILSDGKGGHQGMHKLSTNFGNAAIKFPDEVLAELRLKSGWEAKTEPTPEAPKNIEQDPFEAANRRELDSMSETSQ